MLLEKVALRRLILPAVLRELFLTGCALAPVVLAHCEEKCCRLSDFEYLQKCLPQFANVPRDFRNRIKLLVLIIQFIVSIHSLGPPPPLPETAPAASSSLAERLQPHSSPAGEPTERATAAARMAAGCVDSSRFFFLISNFSNVLSILL